jgi:hypothetical protein
MQGHVRHYSKQQAEIDQPIIVFINPLRPLLHKTLARIILDKLQFMLHAKSNKFKRFGVSLGNFTECVAYLITKMIDALHGFNQSEKVLGDRRQFVKPGNWK